MKKLIFILAITLLSQVTIAQEEKKPLQAFVVTYKDDKGNHTGDYFKIYTYDKSETMQKYVYPQAKLLAAQGKKYSVQSWAVTEGECGIVHSYIDNKGKLILKWLVVDKSKANEKENKLREDKQIDYKIHEVICL
jgi:predicted component of type VI protein secretion system